MHLLYPPQPARCLPTSLDDAALARLYGYPTDRGSAVRGNMVGSLDGAATVDGLSGGLSSPADRRIFWLLRGLADVILVGAGTARSEGYRPTRGTHSWAALGLRDGRPSAPPLALVSRSLDLDPAAPLIAQAPADARTIVITCAASPADRRAALAGVADVIVAGDDSVDLKAALSALAARGLARVLCEGGPRLLSDVIAGGPARRAVPDACPRPGRPGPGPRASAAAPFRPPPRAWPTSWKRTACSSPGTCLRRSRSRARAAKPGCVAGAAVPRIGTRCRRRIPVRYARPATGTGSRSSSAGNAGGAGQRGGGWRGWQGWQGERGGRGWQGERSGRAGQAGPGSVGGAG